MKNIINPYSIRFYLILFLVILIITCLNNTVFAFDLRQGEIISRVNLRQAPGLQGKIITGIQRGTIVIVKDRQGDWYRIIVSSETYGYEGWIYGKYLRHFSETASHPAIAIPNDSMKFVTTETDAGIPEQSSPEESAAWQNTEYPDSGSVPADEPTNSDTAIYIQPPEKLTKKSVNLAAKIKPKKKMNYDKEKINKTQLDFLNNGKVSKSSDKIISLIKEKKKTPLISDDNNSLKKNTGWLRLILKFASVILSCFAILLSYKALQFAKETREMVMQFKQ
ncbi:MAG: SH3 domain-containing protein [Deltaproteobacteria bacterium]|nr:SH3 domain-containing protein [Deltaproteobacteria bacterium]